MQSHVKSTHAQGSMMPYVARVSFPTPYGCFEEKRAIEPRFIRKPPKDLLKQWVADGLIVWIKANDDDHNPEESQLIDDPEFNINSAMKGQETLNTNQQQEQQFDIPDSKQNPSPSKNQQNQSKDNQGSSRSDGQSPSRSGDMGTLAKPAVSGARS